MYPRIAAEKLVDALDRADAHERAKNGSESLSEPLRRVLAASLQGHPCQNMPSPLWMFWTLPGTQGSEHLRGGSSVRPVAASAHRTQDSGVVPSRRRSSTFVSFNFVLLRRAPLSAA